jgi:peptide/nickel transport system substrate-binding protein
LGAKFKDLISLTAPDKYTVIFKWKTPNPEAIMETMQSGGVEMNIECPDLVKQYGDTQDWHRAIGTGPFILKDLVAGSSATLMKNPNYWGYDERHSQNKIPYIDTLKVLIIPDDATALAALRTGKIDVMDQMLLSQAQSMKKTNPEILQSTVPYASGMTVNPKNSVAPFNDIRVRKAMQMALDLPTIAATYYGGTSDPHPLTLTSYFEKGWGLPYDQWPQDLKDEYTYNPTASKKLLADAGYPTGFKTNVVADAGGDLDLLQIVKSYFSQVGIDMEIRPMDGASWNTFVRVQMKYDQLAYRSQGSLGLTFEPMTQLNQFQTGLSVNYYGVSDPIFDTFYPKALASTSVDQIKQVVKDANLQVAQQHYLISILQAPTFAFAQPWLKGFSNQGKAVTATGAGPSYLGFYAARYWIDQNMKKGMGH